MSSTSSTKIVFFCYWQKQNPYFVTNQGQKPLFFVANQRQQAIDLSQISGNNLSFCRKSEATNLIISLS